MGKGETVPEPTAAAMRAAEDCWARAFLSSAPPKPEEVIRAFAEIIEQETGLRELLAVCELAARFDNLEDGGPSALSIASMARKAVSAQHKPDIGPSEIIFGDEGDAH